MSIGNSTHQIGPGATCLNGKGPGAVLNHTGRFSPEQLSAETTKWADAVEILAGGIN